MNYISLIQRFWQLDLEYNFSSTDTRLYFFLVQTCNQLNWKNPFGHSDRFLAQRIGSSVNTVRDARKRLAEHSLIEYSTPQVASKGVKGQTMYRIIEPTVSKIDTVDDEKPQILLQTVSNFDTVDEKNSQILLPTVSKIDTVSNTVHQNCEPTVSGTVSKIDTVSDTNNKQNKTKDYLNPVAQDLGSKKNCEENFSDKEKNLESNPTSEKREEAPLVAPAPPNGSDFPELIIEAFCDEYRKNRGFDYEITSKGKERKHAGAFIKLYRKTMPRADTKTALVEMREFFQLAISQTTDQWLHDSISIPVIVSQFNKLKNILRNEHQENFGDNTKSLRANGSKRTLSHEQFAATMARKFAESQQER